jgi:hypothetical protein
MRLEIRVRIEGLIFSLSVEIPFSLQLFTFPPFQTLFPIIFLLSTQNLDISLLSQARKTLMLRFRLKAITSKIR